MVFSRSSPSLINDKCQRIWFNQIFEKYTTIFFSFPAFQFSKRLDYWLLPSRYARNSSFNRPMQKRWRGWLPAEIHLEFASVDFLARSVKHIVINRYLSNVIKKREKKKKKRKKVNRISPLDIIISMYNKFENEN